MQRSWIEALNKTDADLNADEEVYSETMAHDPYQPDSSLVTHPLAIKARRIFQESKHAHSIITRHCHCVNTSFVES